MVPTREQAPPARRDLAPSAGAFQLRACAAVEDARTAAKVASGKTLHDLRGTFATRLMHNGFEGREIDEVLGWETGKSARIRRVYISRKAVVISAIERMRKRDKGE